MNTQIVACPTVAVKPADVAVEFVFAGYDIPGIDLEFTAVGEPTPAAAVEMLFIPETRRSVNMTDAEMMAEADDYAEYLADLEWMRMGL